MSLRTAVILWLLALVAGFAAGYNLADLRGDLRATTKESADQKSVIAIQDQVRQEESRRGDIVEGVSRETSNSVDVASVSDSGAAATTERLRNEVALLQRRFVSSQASCDARIAGQRSSAEKDFGLLSGLYNEAVDELRRLAKEAEGYRIAGNACSAIYDGVRNSPPQTTQ